MPTQTTPRANLTPGQHARNYWWNPSNGPMRNVGRIIRNVFLAGGNPLVAAANTARAVAFGEAREGLSGIFNRQRADRDNIGAGPPPGLAGPDYSNAGPPSSLADPGYSMGPPSELAGGAPRAPMPRQPSGPVGPSRNDRTIAEGEAAVDWARALSMANSGLNASGGSFDRLNQYAGMIQR